MSNRYDKCGRVFNSLMVIIVSVTSVYAQADLEAEAEVSGEVVATEMTPAELEQAAAAKQEADQEMASQLVPFASGIVFGGLDAEAPSSIGVVVFENGRVGLSTGEIASRDSGYVFSDTTFAPKSAGWLGLPCNRLMLIAAVKWISISAVFGWPFVAFVLRGTLYENDKHDSTGGSHFFRFTAWTANLLILAILVVLQLLVIRRPELWAGAPNLHFEHIYPLCWGLIGASAFSLLGSVVAWTKGYWRVPGRIHYTLAVLNAAVFLGYLHQMGVLSQVFTQAT